MHCRACQRDHAGPECPVDELGRPSPAPGLVPVMRGAPARWATGTTTTTSNAYGAGINITVMFQPTSRRPPDDGLTGVPALVR